MRIKPPALQPPAPGLQLYDYIVEIHADKVIIKHAEGEITLQSVDELNEWLNNVRDKRIAVFSYVPLVEGAIYLTRNYYYFASGQFLHIYPAEGGIVLISDAHFVEVWNVARAGHSADISNSYFSINAESVKFYSAGANITITGNIESLVLNGTSLRAVVARGVYMDISYCTIDYLDVDYLYVTMINTQINEYYAIVAHRFYDLRGVVVSDRGFGSAYFTVVDYVSLSAHETATYTIYSHGVSAYFYIYYVHVVTDPPDATPVSYTYSFDPNAQELHITITNPNDIPVTAMILVKAEAYV
jgi:hypothetical protein